MEDAVFVFVTHLSLGIVEPLLKLSRECLMPDKAPGGRGDDDDEEEVGLLARAAVLINCRIENSGDAASRFRLLCGGYSILLQLRDASLVLVSLSGEKTGEEGFPLMVRFPSALFPAHSTVASLTRYGLISEALPLMQSWVKPTGRAWHFSALCPTRKAWSYGI
ncbi:hypothetical protein C4B63_9g528 [Trypanosoma cruzi]|uniref:Uncharacterized protein n=1 Tax=Trypanosoma cruzi TaxID=5693 RepID=A0A2V2VT29_TRYCR|nr:hypothetical protein C4B63_9g528 [Trypanosoma cruzi]